jgi:hypothetical protein
MISLIMYSLSRRVASAQATADYNIICTISLESVRATCAPATQEIWPNGSPGVTVWQLRAAPPDVHYCGRTVHLRTEVEEQLFGNQEQLHQTTMNITEAGLSI